MTKEEQREQKRKYYLQHREERIKYSRKYNAEHRKELCEATKKRQAKELNKNWVKKCNIRSMSLRLLKKCHTKLPGYEIHHCFGYEDPKRFIYIPKSLHLKIHQFLRDNGIPSDIDHWNEIRELVNSCEEYTYIKA